MLEKLDYVFPVAAELLSPIKCTTAYFYTILIGLQKVFGGSLCVWKIWKDFFFHTSLAVTELGKCVGFNVALL